GGDGWPHAPPGQDRARRSHARRREAAPRSRGRGARPIEAEGHMSQIVLDKLRAKFGDAILETHSDFGDDTAVVDASKWREVCEFVRNDPALQFDLPVDLCGVDYPERTPRMEVVAHLYSTTKNHRVRLKARVGDEDMEGAELDSITPIWPGMNWLER